MRFPYHHQGELQQKARSTPKPLQQIPRYDKDVQMRPNYASFFVRGRVLTRFPDHHQGELQQKARSGRRNCNKKPGGADRPLQQIPRYSTDARMRPIMPNFAA